MRWNSSAFQDWDPPAWFGWIMAVLLFPIWGPLVAVLWLETSGRRIKRKYLGPYVGRWQRWFAWRPVTLDNGWGDTVWLETVERQSLGSSHHFGVTYQALNLTPSTTQDGK